MNKAMIVALLGGVSLYGAGIAHPEDDDNGHTTYGFRDCHTHEQHGAPGWRPGMFGMDLGHRLRRMAKVLELTPDQTSQIRLIAKQNRITLQALRDKVRDNRGQFRKLMQSDQPDNVQLTSLAEAQGKLHTQVLLAMTTTRMDIFKVLTPQQQDKLKSLRDQKPTSYQDDDDESSS
ncbi:MAG: Spy/CpxP family protein refolding chaperone [Gammaproteobacteria bacterium]|nr:Spy/CpxP family protein refolding chaperone [Gammaproteobacteria bacterium]